MLAVVFIQQASEIIRTPWHPQKEVASLARRTFATTVLLFNDVPMEIVSALLGHAKMSVTQESYAKIVKKKIGAAMAVFYKGMKGN